MLREQVVDVLQHRRSLLLGEDGAVAARADELLQHLPVDLVDVAEDRTLDRPEQATRVIGSADPVLDARPPHHRIAELAHPGLTLVPDVPDKRDAPTRTQHPRDLDERGAVVEPVERLRDRDDVGALRRTAGSPPLLPRRPSPREPPSGAGRASRAAARRPSPGDRGRRATASAFPCRHRDRRRRTAPHPRASARHPRGSRGASARTRRRRRRTRLPEHVAHSCRRSCLQASHPRRPHAAPGTLPLPARGRRSDAGRTAPAGRARRCPARSRPRAPARTV